MRSRETLLRLHRFRTEDRRRQAADIDGMIQDLTRKYDELDSHVRFEESRNGVTDPANVNYSMAAKATRGRRDNLLKSISDLKDQKAAVLAQLADELEGYTMTKSALHFAVDEPLPKALVEKLIDVRIAENQ